MDIVIDFDGTCVTHDFPEIGKDIGAVPILKRLIDKGHNLILFTMRSDRFNPSTIEDKTISDVYGPFLTEAINWFKQNEIPLYGIQGHPTQHTWTTSPKAYGQLIIDDAALGCPLIINREISHRPYADWYMIEELLINMGLL